MILLSVDKMWKMHVHTCVSENESPGLGDTPQPAKDRGT